MHDVDVTPPPAPRPHLLADPDPSFWSDTLFYGRFEELLAATATTAAAEATLLEVFKGGPARAVAQGIIERSGGGLNPTRHLVLVGAFTEFKHSDAIETVAHARLGASVVQVNSTPGGKVRRHALMALLYETDPRFLFEVLLWHRHFGRRRSRYRLAGGQSPPALAALAPWEDHAKAALPVLQAKPASGCKEFDRVCVAPGITEGDVLVGLREWPATSTGRGRDGAVATVEVPDWTTLHFAELGARLEVSDLKVDRGAHFAGELASRLVGDKRTYNLVLSPLSDRALREFLARVTDPVDETFPLVELVAEAPWRPHQIVTLTGTRRTTTEELVADLRELHPPFARDWRTVKSVKLAFEGRFTIQVHFPRPGEPMALSYSDDGRSEKVSQRFSKLLEEHLHVEVAAKARRGARKARIAEGKAPRKNSAGWWRAILGPNTDRPAEWLETAVEALADQGLVRTERARVFPCNSPYVDRATFRVDSLDCDGEVLLPHDLPLRDDHTQLEDDGEVVCSAGLHRWRPMRFGLPTTVRLYVEVQHEAMLAHLAGELAHYGEVRGVPGRPGVLTVRLDDVVGTLVYVPLAHVEELDRENHGKRNPVAWIAAPGARPPRLPEGCLELSDVLADYAELAACWGTSAWKRRRSQVASIDTAVLAAEPEAPAYSTAATVLALTDRGVAIGSETNLITTGRHHALRVLWALWQAAMQDQGDRTARQLWSWEHLDALLPEEWRAPGTYDEERKKSWHTWISRTRKALREGSGEPGFDKRVVVSKGSRYRLGDGFVVDDLRLQAGTGD